MCFLYANEKMMRLSHAKIHIIILYTTLEEIPLIIFEENFCPLIWCVWIVNEGVNEVCGLPLHLVPEF